MLCGVGEMVTNFCFFLQFSVVFHAHNLHQTIQRKKRNKKGYGDECVR